MFAKATAVRSALCGSCALIALAAAQTARAQEAAGGQAAEVVVTAQKRAQNIQDVPAAVSVFSNESLNDFHVTQLADIGAYIPGLQINSSGTAGQTTISIRGIAPVGPGATVGTYVDDIPVGGSSNYSRAVTYQLDLLPYDVANIEVLRGPQGTLYGASTMGGLLKYDLIQPSVDKPTFIAGGDLFGVKGADDVGGGGRAFANMPLVQDKLGLLASYAYEGTPGYIDDPRLGVKDQNGVSQQSARLGLLWRPTDKVTVVLGALYQQVQADGNGTIALDPATLKPLLGDLRDQNLRAQPFRKDVTLLSARVNWDLDWATLTSVTSYTYADTKSQQDGSYTYGVLFPLFGAPAEGASAFDLKLQLRKYTQEFRLASPSGQRFEWLVGAFVTYERSSNLQLVDAQTFAGVPLAGLSPLATAGLPSTYREYAGFADGTYHFTDKLELSAGVRYSENNQSFRQISGGALLPTADQAGRSSEGIATFSVSPAYHLTKDIYAYMRFASGYQPGGPNIVFPNVPPSVDSDTLTNYEIGLKTQFWRRRATLNVAAFDIEWDDIQISSNNDAGVTFLTNGGTARSRGVELEGSVRPLPGLTLGGNFTYTDAVLTADAPGAGGKDGDRLPDVPKLSGAVTADYTHAWREGWSWRVGGGLRAQDHRFSMVQSDPTAFREPGYAVLDLNAAVFNDRYTVRLFAKNLNDKRAIQTDAPIQNGATGAVTYVSAAILQPRTIGVALDAKF